MRAKQSGPGSPERPLFLHFVRLEVGLNRGRLSRQTAGTPGRAALGQWLLPSTDEQLLGCAHNILMNN